MCGQDPGVPHGTLSWTEVLWDGGLGEQVG